MGSTCSTKGHTLWWGRGGTKGQKRITLAFSSSHIPNKKVIEVVYLSLSKL